jgi:methylenetetrahydrofolate dehydrogenase (NADP+)/methenyltetrahydrofolate cyclohydrolase
MRKGVINGKEIAKNLRNKIMDEVKILQDKYSLKPGLAVIIVGKDPASEVYVKNKNKFAKECGLHSLHIAMPAEITEKELLLRIEELNQDSKIHGILIQLPLPKHISRERVLNKISPQKDVDGFTPLNAGLLFSDAAIWDKTLMPCTPKGCLILIWHVLGKNLIGKKAVIIGSSNIVGRPMAALLLNERCTVTITHSRTKNLKEELIGAEIIVIGTGVPNLLRGDMVTQGAVVIDVGINRLTDQNGETKLVGDANFDEMLEKASFVTPVPGGVGPMTIACLLQNVVIAACNHNNIEYSRLLS